MIVAILNLRDPWPLIRLAIAVADLLVVCGAAVLVVQSVRAML